MDTIIQSWLLFLNLKKLYLCAMPKNALKLTLLVLIMALIAGCSKYQRVFKSTDNELKYETAIALYEKKDYYRALQLFDQLMPVFKGTEREEKMSYFYAYSYYYQKDYMLAGYYFKRFATSYPVSKYAEECYFMNAYCSYLNSPPVSLDQTSSVEAIKEFQAFINKYPASDKLDRSNELIDKLRLKLEEKAYNIANMYLHMDEYLSAVVSYKTLMQEFPDTRFREEAMYNIIKAYHFYAVNSIDEKRIERHRQAINAYNDFKALYPESKLMKQATDLIQSSIKQVKKEDNS